MSNKIQRALEYVTLSKGQENQVLNLVDGFQKEEAELKVKQVKEALTVSNLLVDTLDLKALYDSIRVIHTSGRYGMVVRMCDVLLDYLPNKY